MAGASAWPSAPKQSELFYLDGKTLKSVTFGSDFRVGEPQPLFDLPYATPTSEDTPRTFDVHPDGRHFLMVRRTEAERAALPRLNVILGWASDLSRR